MSLYRIDLHNHTPFVFSDYKKPDASPEELVAAALGARIDILGVTDHYSIGWWDQMYTAAEAHGAQDGQRLIVLPGAEVKALWRDDDVHLVALFDPDVAVTQFAAIASRLGVAREVGDVAELPYLQSERDPVEVVQRVTDLGAMCVLAHVDRRFGDYRLCDRPLFDRMLLEAPLSAIEVLALDTAEELRERAPQLTFIRSSDSHAPDEIGRRTTELELRSPTFEGLREALWSARVGG